MNKEKLAETLSLKHGFQNVELKINREKISTFEEINYTFSGEKGDKKVEGTLLYAIEYGRYVVTEKPNTSGYWL